MTPKLPAMTAFIVRAAHEHSMVRHVRLTRSSILTTRHQARKERRRNRRHLHIDGCVSPEESGRPREFVQPARIDHC